jgi:dolichol-phosphate mannosyltransferase
MRQRQLGALLFSERIRPLRFAITGGAAAIVQLCLLATLTHQGWNSALANITSFLLAAQVNFALSALFTWRDRRPAAGAAPSALRARWAMFHASIAGTALLNQLVFLAARAVLPTLVASALGIATSSLINYATGNWLVFPVRVAARPAAATTPQRRFSMTLPQAPTVRQDAASLAPPVFTVIAPVYNEVETLPRFYERVVAAMERLGEPFEVVLVNDGSADGSDGVLRRLYERDPRVRVVALSRNFGHQMALSAGLAYARGHAVVLMDADLQDPPEIIPALVAKWREGAEVVYAQRASRSGETRFKLLTASAFYWLIARMTSVAIPRDTGDFRLLDRRVVDTLVVLPEHHRFLRGLSAWVGFRQAAVPYHREERFAGATKYPLHKMLTFSLDAITGFSYAPLQLATTFGFLLAGISLVGIVAAAVLRLATHAIVGQASTLILVLFLGGIQLIFLGIIGEYLGRIYDEVRARPLYIVREVLEAKNGGA